MKNQLLVSIVLFFFIYASGLKAQEETSVLFQVESPMLISLRYSNKEMRKETSDSSFIKASLVYQGADGQWDSLTVRLQARGNWRRANCFLTPVKMRIKKKQRKDTPFEDDKELKLVLPCQNSDRGHDYIIKEYLAYKLYEVVAPYHFKTRRLEIDYSDVKKRKEKGYELAGFMIEDITRVAKRNDAKRVKNKVHPLEQDDYMAITNDFFQYLIGNTDFSTNYQHNEKLIYVDGKDIIPIPYDFDMSGLVDASYAVVSQVQGEILPIESVRERLFRGFERDPAMYEQVRQGYLSKKDEMLQVVMDMEDDFINHRDYRATLDYVNEFFEVLEDDNRFQREILEKTRAQN